jgi:hypothetical protein
LPLFAKSRIFIVIGFFVFLFFLYMSRIEFIINQVLYSYGLKFSYNWAYDYWTTFYSIFIVFSLIVGFLYWVTSKKTTHDIKVVTALTITVNLLAVGGLQDIFYFVFWAGGLPSTAAVWRWSVWTSVFGSWTTELEMNWFVAMISVSALVWGLVIYGINDSAKMKPLKP